MMTDSERLQIKKNCDSFLHGHYPVAPRDYFIDLGEKVSSDECQDHYGMGPSLQNFEKYLAELLGAEDCLFFQSGTMAQLIAMRIWTDEAESKLIGYHPTCHLNLHEKDAYRELHGLRASLIGETDRIINRDDLNTMKEKPSTIILELPQREIGGQLPDWNSLVEQVEFLRSQQIRIHLDGARLWECQAFYRKEYSEICRLFDSVYISFYKGIGAVAGAALLGPNDFISKAKIWNRRHGGNLITAFPLYLSAQINLQKRIDRFSEYYDKTIQIASDLSQIPETEILPKVPQVNMFHLLSKGNPSDLSGYAFEVSRKSGIWGLNHWQPDSREGYSKLEWYVGDATMDIPNEKIVKFVERVVSVE